MKERRESVVSAKGHFEIKLKQPNDQRPFRLQSCPRSLGVLGSSLAPANVPQSLFEHLGTNSAESSSAPRFDTLFHSRPNGGR